MTRRLPTPIPPGLHALTPDVPPGVFTDSFHTACESLDAFIDAWLADLAHTLNLDDGSPHTSESLLATRGWHADGRLAMEWILENLALFGHATRHAGGYEIHPRVISLPAETIRQRAVEALPAAAPAFEIMARACAAVPAVMRGEMQGEAALFGPATLTLWFDYISNANPLYYPNNALTAAAVARQVGPGARLLELGGGGGSAAEAVLQALTKAGSAPASYCFTELAPAFLRRGTRVARAVAPEGCTVTAQLLGLSRRPGVERLGGDGFDAIRSVNAMNLAADLVETLSRLASYLRPDGPLVIGELIRPADGAVHLELPFTLLRAYRQVGLIPGVRPRPGFLTLEGWTEALRRAGYRRIEVVPAAVARCAELYPGFYAGVLVARL